MNDFDKFERRLAAAIRSDADQSVGAFSAESVARDAISGIGPGVTHLPKATLRPTGRFGQGRGTTLLAAAALLLVGGALAVGSGALRLPSVVPPEPAPSLAVVTTPSEDATSPSPMDVAEPTAGPTSPPAAGVGGNWIPTETMGTPRVGHTAVRLLDGRVLVVGGQASDGADLTSAELYDPASGTWSATGSMANPLGVFPATLLRDGKVLVGDVTHGAGNDRYGAELYDPAAGTWSPTGSLATGEFDHAATLLNNGMVLVSGDPSQRYDPDTGTWSSTGRMVTPRWNHTATLLPDGKVLAVGGEFPSIKAELYDPDTGTWTATADMLEKHQSHDGDGIGVVLLNDGTVLLAGRGSAELYDPTTGVWTATRGQPTLNTPYSTATLLPDGTVLMTPSQWMADPGDFGELYDPTTGSWAQTGSMPFRSPGTATLLRDGTVLLAGASDGQATSSAELYVPAGVAPPGGLPLPSPTPRPIPTPTSIPTPIPSLYPPQAGPVPAGARSWTVTVVNKSSEPGTLFLAEEGGEGIGRLCGSVTPNVVPAGVTQKVTFELPSKRVKDCWIWVNPAPGRGGSLFQTSDAPMAGRISFQAGEGGAQGGWLGQ